MVGRIVFTWLKGFVILPLLLSSVVIFNSPAKAQKKCGFPVSRPYLGFGRRNPDPKLFYWIMLVSVST
jgi:hypothetical protein